jgi:hypothetical protein
MGGRPGAWKIFGLPGAGGLAAAAAGAFAAGGLAAAAVGAFAAGGLTSGVGGAFAAGGLAACGGGVAAGVFFATVLTVFLAGAFLVGAFLAGALAGAGLAPETAVGRSARPELLKLVRNRSATSASMPLRLDLTWMPIFSRVAMISSAGTPVSFASL